MYYVAYGSNLHPGRLRDRVPAATLAGSAALQGWWLRWHKRSRDGSGKCNIVESPGRQIHVAVHQFDHRHLRLLDDAEGLGKGYEHHEVDVPGFGTALTYRAAVTHIDETLKPYDWYKAYVLLGCTFHGFDPGYIAGIRQLSTAPDPDRRRHAMNMARIESLQAADPG